jgi:NhaA family Na+:H+ antiporter
LNLMGVRRVLPFLLVGVVVWYFLLKSGVHSTIAGVLVALTIPARTRVDRAAYASFAEKMLGKFRAAGVDGGRQWATDEQQGILQAMEDAGNKVETPLRRLEHNLIPWVAFLILPVFALANAGVALGGGDASENAEPTARVLLGVSLGLLLGKPIGVFACSWLAVKTGVATLPAGVSWGQIHATGWLAGIGFTMAFSSPTWRSRAMRRSWTRRSWAFWGPRCWRAWSAWCCWPVRAGARHRRTEAPATVGA